MEKIVQFCKECDAFFVTTKNGQYPSSRPFGAIMENNNKLYICSNNKKKVYKQIKADNHIHIVAIKRSSRTWMRFNAIAKEIDDIALKELFFSKCPRLPIIYGTPHNKYFVMFELKISKYELHLD